MAHRGEFFVRFLLLLIFVASPTLAVAQKAAPSKGKAKQKAPAAAAASTASEDDAPAVQTSKPTFGPS